LTFLAGGTTYSFTIMLTAYLCGLALGSLVAVRFVDRTRNLVHTFCMLQTSIGLIILATLAMTPTLLSHLSHFLLPGGVPRYNDFINFAVMESAISLLFIFPSAALMGATFPVAARIYAASRGKVGSGVGTSYFADSIGAIGGSLLAGFWLIPKLGTLASIECMAAVNLFIGALAFAAATRVNKQLKFSLARLGTSIAVLAAVFVLAKSSITRDTFMGIFTAPDSKLAYINEDIGGTVTIEDYGDHRTISINGVNVAGTDLKFETTQKLQAHLALMLHPNPKKVLQIGFGSGGTAWSITRHPVAQIDCVEITEAIIKARDNFRDVNHGVLSDPRVKVCMDDARSYLVKCREQYDAILSDSIHPRRAGNGGLYATDYYQLCRDRLTPDGIFSAWLPIHGMALEDFRVATRSLKAVFPHVYLFHTPMGRTEWAIILGTQHPIKFDVALMRERLKIPAIKEDLHIIQVDRVEDILDCFLVGDKTLQPFLGDGKALNTDDLPYLEYVTPLSTLAGTREQLLVPLYVELIKNHETVIPYLKSDADLPITQMQNSLDSWSHTLQARLLEVASPTNSLAVLRELYQAIQLDPQNNVARNLQRQYQFSSEPIATNP
jgi:spermidine synthase